MLINTKETISKKEASQNFQRVINIVEESGNVIVTDNDRPRYIVIDLKRDEYLSDDVKIEIAARKILEKYRPAFEELAK